MTPLRIIFLFFSYTFVQRACKPIMMFCQHCVPFQHVSCSLKPGELWHSLLFDALCVFQAVCSSCGSALCFASMWNLCILLQGIFSFRPQPVPEDWDVTERSNSACSGEILYWRVPFTGLASRLITSLASATDVTARLCCHFIKLVPAEPSIP